MTHGVGGAAVGSAFRATALAVLLAACAGDGGGVCYHVVERPGLGDSDIRYLQPGPCAGAIEDVGANRG
jgi:hypothetical protein